MRLLFPLAVLLLAGGAGAAATAAYDGGNLEPKTLYLPGYPKAGYNMEE